MQSDRRKTIAIFFNLGLCLFIAAGMLPGLQKVQAAPKDQAPQPPHGVYRGVSTAVKFDISPPLASITPLQVKPGAEVEIPERPSGLEGAPGPQDIDPLVQTTVGTGEMPVPLVSFNGPGNISGVSPPDPVGDVGPNHYVAMSNLSFQIFNKSGVSLYGPALNNTLWAGFGGACQTDNAGDPIVVYDQMADRWMLTQFTSSGPTYFNCVALSTTGDPTGSYYRWAFSTGNNFPDYPKYGVWPDAYYISTREFAGGSTFVGMGAYAVNRAQMIAGNPAPQVISFLATPASAGGAYNLGDGLLPTDMDGSTLPPAGSPNYYLGAMDNGGPYGAPQDALTLWKFHVDFTTPALSTFTLANTLPIAAYDTIFPCSPTSRNCIPQPGTTNKVDILSYRQRPLWRLAYRNFGTHESLVTNQSVEASTSMAGIRWWEIRSPNSSPVLYQEGTYAPGTTDGIHRWMGSIAMDQDGNMALGYSASDGTSTYPSSWYTGRLVADPLGTLPQGEASIINGTGSQTGSGRWGDYTSMNVDPVDDCTFWYVNQWIPTTSSVGWQLRIGSFKYPSCPSGQPPDFTLNATPPTQAICAGTDASYDIAVGTLGGFGDPVTLSAAGNPAGTTTGFNLNPVSPPGNSLMTIGNTGGAAAGSYTVVVTGTAAALTHAIGLGLDVFNAVPSAPTLLSPANYAVNQPLQPTFTWTASSQAGLYDLEVASDAGFTAPLVYTATVAGTAHPAGAPLPINTILYWRVRSSNLCGPGAYSPTFVFLSGPAAGSCPVYATPTTIFTDTLETGAPGWTHSGTGDTWALSTANPHSPVTAFRAADPAAISDQRLVSPVVALPVGQDPLLLSFWSTPNLENSGATACYDGGILEVSADGGSTWTQVPNGSLLQAPYTGPVSATFGNPLAGLNAWCGETNYTNPIADISAYAGQNAQFRFRLGSDTSVSRPGWDIDDVQVQSCLPGYYALLQDDQSQTALPGAGLSYVFTLWNVGSDDDFDLSLSGNAFPTSLQTATPLNVSAGTAVNITVQVDLPAVVPDNLDVSDTFTLTAASTGDPAQVLQVSGTTRSLVTPGALLTPPSQSHNGAPGGMVTHTLTLTNTGNYTDTFSLAVSGNAWPTTAPSSVQLGPGADTLLEVQVGIPPQPAGEAVIVSDSFTLTATSSLSSILQLAAAGTTSASVTPGVSLGTAEPSLTGTPGQVVVYTVQVNNTGDFVDSFDLSVSGVWSATLSQSSVGPLLPGDSASVQVSVQIPANAASGDSDTTTLSAVSALDSAETASADLVTVVANRQIYLPLIQN